MHRDGFSCSCRRFFFYESRFTTWTKSSIKIHPVAVAGLKWKFVDLSYKDMENWVPAGKFFYILITLEKERKQFECSMLMELECGQMHYTGGMIEKKICNL